MTASVTGATGRLRIADGTLIGVANYAGCAERSEFAGVAGYDYCASKSRYYWGLRLVLLTDRAGLPLGYTLLAANEKEYEQHLAKTPAGLLQRIAQRLLALTLGILINALPGRPPRALVAYDGR